MVFLQFFLMEAYRTELGNLPYFIKKKWGGAKFIKYIEEIATPVTF